MKETNIANDVSAIHALYESWFRAMERGDVSAILALVTTDVIVKMPGSQPIVGKDALEEALRAFFGENSEVVDYDIEALEVSGDLAFARISEMATIRSKSSTEVLLMEGTHLVDLHRQADGRWLVARDISSLNGD